MLLAGVWQEYFAWLKAHLTPHGKAKQAAQAPEHHIDDAADAEEYPGACGALEL